MRVMGEKTAGRSALQHGKDSNRPYGRHRHVGIPKNTRHFMSALANNVNEPIFENLGKKIGNFGALLGYDIST